MNADVRVMITMILVMSTIILMLAFRKKAVSCYVTIWLFMPHAGQVIFGYPPDIPQFAFVELSGAIMLAIIALSFSRPTRVLVNNGHAFQYCNHSNFLLKLIGVTILLQLFITTIFLLDIIGQHQSIPVGKFVVSFSSEISGFLFLFAVLRLVRSLREVEMVMKVFIWCALALTANYLIVILFPGTLGLVEKYSFDEKGLFFSIFLNDYILVSLVVGLSSLFCLYFSVNRRNILWVVLAIILGLMVFISFKRSIILAYLMALMVFVYFEYMSQKNRLMVWLIVFLLAIFVTINTEQILQGTSGIFQTEYLMKRVMNVGSLDSFVVRLGIQLRGLDIISTYFPIGVGNNMLRYHMAGSLPAGFSPSDPSLMEGYYSVLNGKITESHNGYFEQLASYGFLGIVSLMLLIFIITRNLLQSFSNRLSASGLYGVSLATASFLGTYYLLLGYPRFFVAVFILLQMTFVLRHTSYYKFPVKLLSRIKQ